MEIMGQAFVGHEGIAMFSWCCLGRRTASRLSPSPPQSHHEEVHHNYNDKNILKSVPGKQIRETNWCSVETQLYNRGCNMEDCGTYLNDSVYAEIVLTSIPHSAPRFANSSGVCILCAPEIISSPISNQ
jgi:hypothetical protein